MIALREFDAMAVHQALSALPSEDPLQKLPVVSLPNGCNNLPPDLVLRLERFSKIYLWLDNDVDLIAIVFPDFLISSGARPSGLREIFKEAWLESLLSGETSPRRCPHT